MTLTGTKTECLTAVTLENKTLGYPLPGKHYGGGYHVPMPEAWDGTGAAPPGWTVANQETEVVPAAKTGDWTVTLDDQFTAEKVAASTTLTSQEKATATSLLGKATTTTTTPK